MNAPLPGQAVRGSRTGRPIMALFDLLGRRMALRVLWELTQARGPLTFRALQDAAETNPAVLNQRLKELRAAGLVCLAPGGYGLTEEGRALERHLGPLGDWAAGWADALAKQASSRMAENE
jgi:DNA-binding HxlR family transcriptional regulator